MYGLWLLQTTENIVSFRILFTFTSEHSPILDLKEGNCLRKSTTTRVRYYRSLIFSCNRSTVQDVQALEVRCRSLLDVPQCDKKRSNTLLTISVALGVLKPVSFKRLSCCLRYRPYDWTKSPACDEDHHCHPWGMQIAVTSNTCNWSRDRSHRNNILLIKQLWVWNCAANS